MSPRDLTTVPDLRHERHTGPFRTQHPTWVSHLPPCNEACPAGEDIQGWLSLAQAGRYEEAWRHLVRDNPMPSVHGRVCYHPCESSCNRAALDTTVSIHAVERFLGDEARKHGWTITPERPPSGKRVLVVGAGPSGLSAAWHLARRGHAVEVHEAGPAAGGMMLFGIPAYRLPRDVLAEEVRRIASMGVTFVFNRKVDDLLAEKARGKFDAVFLAIGAHLGKRTEIPSRDAGKMLDALSFLRDAATGEAPKLGRRVAIYGGGNTAMDAARTAKRLGYEPMIIYRRDRAHMPAHPIEADEALAEGVKIHWLRTIKSIEGTSFTVEEMAVDEKGRPQPTGRLETLEADALVLALGQDVDTSFLSKVPGIERKADGTVSVTPSLMTGEPGIFAGGDMVPSERTVTVAVGHGKKAAREIDAWLHGQASTREAKHPGVTFPMLKLPYATVADTKPEIYESAEFRVESFQEVRHGLAEPEARYEAQRCLSCGNCYECDGCFGACPETAIVKLGAGRGYRVDLNKCTGCAVCFDQCPCHAIEMAPDAAPAATKGR